MKLSKGPGATEELVVAPADERSSVFSEMKLRNDYKLFFREEDKDPDSKSTTEMQVAIFKKFRDAAPIDAWEFLLARKWDEWDEEEKAQVYSDFNDSEKLRWGHLLVPKK